MEQKGEAVLVGELEKEAEAILAEAIQENEEQKVEYAFVLNDFFEQNFSDPEEVLDKNKGKSDRETRVYVCLKIEWETNTFLIPLRRELPRLSEKLFQKACYPVPSENRPHAGLDFRKIIVVNDPSLYRIDEAKISAKQRNKMQDNFEEIKKLAIDYVKGFKKVARKNRQKREPLYKYSALNNFLVELGIK